MAKNVLSVEKNGRLLMLMGVWCIVHFCILLFLEEN